VPPAIAAKVEEISALCAEYNIPIKAAALHFSLAHPASAAVIPGASKPERVLEDHAALKTIIPADFWYELRKRGLVAEAAPLPIDKIGCRDS
jgi:D-threo-aldose 1-dehydrogenase